MSTVKVITGGKERPDVLGQALREKNRHWNFLLKEMMWMADDFQQERKRHMVRYMYSVEVRRYADGIFCVK